MRESTTALIVALAGATLGVIWATKRLEEVFQISEGLDRPWTEQRVPSPPDDATIGDLVAYLACAAKRSLEIQDQRSGLTAR